MIFIYFLTTKILTTSIIIAEYQQKLIEWRKYSLMMIQVSRIKFHR
uniref:Uncharacterized protein n=1 Tax=Arundo donax TaxID=35708 RepID=A0A0A8Z336_ARUDO